MTKTVRVTVRTQIWDKKLAKNYTKGVHYLVHDPESILVEGDVVEFTKFPPTLKSKREAVGKMTTGKEKTQVLHVLKNVVSPWGTSLKERRLRRYVEQLQKAQARLDGTDVEVKQKKKKVAQRSVRRLKGKAGRLAASAAA
jgi:ribosomal protein S17